MAEYIYTNLPQYVKLNSRSEFSSSVVAPNHLLLFSEDGRTITAKNSDGNFIHQGGTDVSDTTAESGTVLGGYYFYDSGGTKTAGSIPTVSATISGNAVIVPAGYIPTSQTFNVSGSADVTLGVVDSQGKFQAFSFSGTTPTESGSPETVLYYKTWNSTLPIPSIGTDVSDTTATPATVLSGYAFYTSAGTKTSGTIPTLGSSSYTPGTADQVISSGQYLGGEQTILGDANLVGSNILSGVSIFGVPGTLVTSSGAEVTLGYISSGMFQPLTFSGTSAYNGGSAVNLSCYSWNLPGTGGSSGGSSSGGSSGGSSSGGSSSGGSSVNSITSDGAIVNSGDVFVTSGNIWTNATINSGGRIIVSASGEANGVTVNSGGTLTIYNGGSASSVTATRTGLVDIFSNGTARDITVNSLGYIYVELGGFADDVKIQAGGSMYVLGSSIGTNICVSSGGKLSISRNGSAGNVIVEENGSAIVYDSGTIVGVVSSGGSVTLFSAADADGLTIAEGAVIINA